MYCTDWSSALSAPNCLLQSLLQNKWANSSSLQGLQEADIVALLVEKLHFFYSGAVHSLVDLSGRKVNGVKGSLCGLSAVYRCSVYSV